MGLIERWGPIDIGINVGISIIVIGICISLIGLVGIPNIGIATIASIPITNNPIGVPIGVCKIHIRGIAIRNRGLVLVPVQV